MGWRDEERARVSQKRAGNKVSLKEGTTIIRIHASKKCYSNGKYNPDADRPLREFRMHYDVGPEGEAVACGMDITAGNPTEDGCDGRGSCWFCQQKIPALLKAGKIALAEKIAPKERFLVMASEVNEDGKMGPALPFYPSTGRGIPGKASSKALATAIHSILSKSGVFVEHPTKGRNIHIEKVATGNKQFPYQIEPPIVDSEESTVPKEVLAKLRPLDEEVPKYSKEEQMRALAGKPREEKPDSDTEEYSEETPETETEETTIEDEEIGSEVEDTDTNVDTDTDSEIEEAEIEETEDEPEIDDIEEDPEPPPPPKKPVKKSPPLPPPSKKPAPAKKR